MEDHPLVIAFENINDKSKKEDLIMAHIKAENSVNEKNHIDELHSLLFKGYATLRGYACRSKKYNVENDLQYPYGLPILGVALIMKKLNNPHLARIEASLLTSQKQSLLAAEALIQLMHYRDISVAKEVVKDDKELSKVMDGMYSLRQTNVDFLPEWVRHYLLAAMDGYWQRSLPVEYQVQSRYRTLCLIYHIVHDTFHPPLSETPISQQFH